MTSAAYAPELKHPSDPRYQDERRERVQTLLRMKEHDLLQKYAATAHAARPTDASGDLHRRLVGGLFEGDLTQHFAPTLRKAILDSTGGGTSGGSVFIRQDLEPIVHA